MKAYNYLFVLVFFMSCTSNEMDGSKNAKKTGVESVTNSEKKPSLINEIVSLDSLSCLLSKIIEGDTISQINSIDDSLIVRYFTVKEFEIYHFARVKSNDTQFEEIFITVDGKLHKAVEYYSFLFPDTIRNIPWKCYYEIDGDSIIDYSSIGLGETESDDWEPESIFDQWQEHEKEIGLLKNTVGFRK